MIDLPLLVFISYIMFGTGYALSCLMPIKSIFDFWILVITVFCWPAFLGHDIASYFKKEIK